jgi:DNA-binding response OmpR family regulator
MLKRLMLKRIMVLEDEQTLYELLHDLLGFEGYEVSKPQNLQTLIEEMHAQLPDAMIIDVNLKGVNGLDLLDQIRADEQLKSIPVLLSSGLDYRRESEQRGADGFLMKPYMPDELFQLLKSKIKH